MVIKSTTGQQVHCHYNGKQLTFSSPADEQLMRSILLETVKKYAISRRRAITLHRNLTVTEHFAINNLLFVAERKKYAPIKEVANALVQKWGDIINLLPNNHKSTQCFWREKMENTIQICNAIL